MHYFLSVTVLASGTAQLRAAVGGGAALFLLEYFDGFTASLLHADGGTIGSWAYAGQV